MFERFTERARMVIVFSQEEARSLGHSYIGTEHVLLGLLREEEGAAARVLESFDITLDAVRAQVVRAVASSIEPVVGQIPFTPRAKKVLELALREALGLGHNYVGPEHILLGLARENEGVAAKILLDFDVDAEKVRNKAYEILDVEAPGPRRTAEDAVELPIMVGASSRLRPVLLAAAQRALSAQRTVIEPNDLLHALAGEESVRALLEEVELEPERLRQAIERRDATD